jgi:hypothetical protein
MGKEIRTLSGEIIEPTIWSISRTMTITSRRLFARLATDTLRVRISEHTDLTCNRSLGGLEIAIQVAFLESPEEDPEHGLCQFTTTENDFGMK